MNTLINDFLQKADLIIKNKKTLSELEKITIDLITKCVKVYEIREGVILLDENFNIVEANDIIKENFEIDPNLIKGKSFFKLFSSEFKDVVEKFLEKTKIKKYNQKSKIYLNFHNKEILVDLRAEKIEIDNKNFYIVSIRKKEVNSIAYKLSVIDEEISNVIIRIKDFESLMKEILNIFVDSKLFDFGWGARVDLELKEIVPVVTLEEKDIDIEFKKKSFDFNYFKGVLDMLLKDTEIIIKDVEFRDKKYKKSLIFPIYKKWEFKNENEIAYATLFYSEKNISFNDEEMIFLKEIIYKINVAITDIFVKEKANLIISTDTLTLLPKREIFIKEIKQLIKEKIPFAIEEPIKLTV